MKTALFVVTNRLSYVTIMIGILLTIVFIVVVYYFLRPVQNNTAVSQTSAVVKKIESELNLTTEARSLCTRLNLSVTNWNVIVICIDMNKISEDLYKNFNSVVEAFLDISKVYLVVQCNAEADQSVLTSQIVETVPVFHSQTQRILFYSTSVGKIAIARQLKPHLYIDYDQEIRVKLAPHIKKTVLLSTEFLGTDRMRLDELLIMNFNK